MLTSPDGERFSHRGRGAIERARARGDALRTVRRASTSACGEPLATDELSIGDYVLSGGELPALVMLDAVARLVPGVVGDEESVARIRLPVGCWITRSTRGRPEFQGHARAGGAPVGAPCGDREVAAEAVAAAHVERRPELLEVAALDADDRELLREIVESGER